MSEDKKEIIASPDGSTRILHCNLLYLDMDAAMPTAKSGKGIEISYKYNFKDEVKTDSKTFPSGKFTGAALKVPENAAILAGFNKLETSPPKTAFTMSSVMKNGFWDLTGIEIGHVGRPGVTKPGQESTGGGGSGGYNSQAAAGQLINLVFDMMMTTVPKGGVTDQGAFLASVADKAVALAPAYEAAKAKVVAALSSGSAAAPVASKPVVTESGKAGDAGDDDVDDDTPFAAKEAPQRPAEPDEFD